MHLYMSVLPSIRGSRVTCKWLRGSTGEVQAQEGAEFLGSVLKCDSAPLCFQASLPDGAVQTPSPLVSQGFGPCLGQVDFRWFQMGTRSSPLSGAFSFWAG